MQVLEDILASYPGTGKKKCSKERIAGVTAAARGQSCSGVKVNVPGGWE